MHRRRPALRAALAAASLALAACSSLLPRTDTTVHTEWNSFDEAKAAIDGIQHNHTTREQLHVAGLDPYSNPNVELLNYSDVLRRFPLSGSVGRIDPGLRECLEAGKACTGYSIALNQQHKDRTGPFLLDLLNFKRVTTSTGWTFNALILMVRDDVVYVVYGGKPSISETEVNVSPLGPLQSWDASGLIR
jgi:hypothetical protein